MRVFEKRFGIFEKIFEKNFIDLGADVQSLSMTPCRDV